MEEKKKNWFVRHKVWTGVLVVIGVLFVLGVIGGAASTGTESETNQTVTSNTSEEASSNSAEETQMTPTVVEATVLVEDFDKNKIAAQDKYTDKLVQTTGVINNISTDITDKYFLSLNPTDEEYYFGTTIACYFADDSAKADITSLENGQSVTVQGVMDDMSLGIIVINDCAIVK